MFLYFQPSFVKVVRKVVVLATVIIEIWEHGDITTPKADGARNMTTWMIIWAIKQVWPDGSV